MDPFTLFLSAIAGGGKLFEGFASSASAELQGNIAQGNADLLDRQADIKALDADVARARGTLEQFRLRRKVDATIAGQRGSRLASGLDPYALTPAMLAYDSQLAGETDAEIIRAAATREAASALTQAGNLRQQATSQRYTAAALKDKEFTDIVSGIFGAATAFLGPISGRGARAGAGAGLSGGGSFTF